MAGLAEGSEHAARPPTCGAEASRDEEPDDGDDEDDGQQRDEQLLPEGVGDFAEGDVVGAGVLEFLEVEGLGGGADGERDLDDLVLRHAGPAGGLGGDGRVAHRDVGEAVLDVHSPKFLEVLEALGGSLVVAQKHEEHGGDHEDHDQAEEPSAGPEVGRAPGLAGTAAALSATTAGIATRATGALFAGLTGAGSTAVGPLIAGDAGEIESGEVSGGIVHDVGTRRGGTRNGRLLLYARAGDFGSGPARFRERRIAAFSRGYRLEKD